MITAAFATRLARRAFQGVGNSINPIYVQPLAPTAPEPALTTAWADIVAHLPGDIAPVRLDVWTFQPYVAPPTEITPYIRSFVAPELVNSGSAPIGPLSWLVVFGFVDGGFEPMWFTPIAPAVVLEPADRLRLNNHVRFRLKGI